MNTNIRTVSVHDTLFGRVANNLEVGQLSRAVEPWFADFHDMRVKQAIADLDEPTRRGAAADKHCLSAPVRQRKLLVSIMVPASRRYPFAGTIDHVLKWRYPEWDSNPQQAGFEPTASASWAIGASRVRVPQ